MAKQHTSRMPFQTTPFGLQDDNVAERTGSPPDQQTYVLQEISLIGNLFYIVKRNESIFIMFQGSTLLLASCAADDKTHGRKYRGNTRLF